MSDKTLIIVESPAKATKISKILGPDFIVKATCGHIVDLSSTGKVNLGVDIENGFKPKYVAIPDKKDKIKTIINSAANSKQIYLASDDDREGEAIAWHLKEILKKTKLPIYRIKFNEITKKGVMAGMKNLGDLDKNLFDAQQARRVLDRIVGFSVSPFLIKNFGPNLSAGRVQSVVVRLIVDREREIEAFKPDEYWKINAELKTNNSNKSFSTTYIKKVIDGKIAAKIKSDLDNDTYKVDSVIETEKSKPPLPPFTTSTLTSSVAGKFKFSATKTMKAAQALYEAGMITYIRTDSVRLSDDSLSECRNWLKSNGHDMPSKPNNYSTKKGAQDAHEAIRPTDVALTSKNVFLPEDQQKVYTLIWERFVASQMNPAIYDGMEVFVKSSSGHMLKTNGRILKYKGWLEITNDLNNDDTDVHLPPLKNKDDLFLTAPKVTSKQKFTKPPSRFTNKTIVEELEKRKIGRPATIAPTIAKITNKNYVVVKLNSFVPTDNGKKVVDNLVNHFDFMKIEYTAEMESKLDQIAEGKLDYVKMLSSFYDPFKNELKKAYTENEKDYGHKCPKCNDKMLLKHGRFGFYMSCVKSPDCKGTLSCDMVDDKPVIRPWGGKIDDGIKCPTCSLSMMKTDGKWGEYYRCSDYKCKGTRKVPYGKKCPSCNGELYAAVYGEENVLFCMNYSDGCRHREPHPENNLKNPSKIIRDDIPKKIKKILK